jgi:archaellum component FlaC
MEFEIEQLKNRVEKLESIVSKLTRDENVQKAQPQRTISFSGKNNVKTEYFNKK